MKTRTDIEHFIPCSCKVGGLIVNGIQVVDMEGIVSIYHVHTYGAAWSGGFWQRIKNAWEILRGRTIMGDDSMLNHEGVTKLRDVCQDVLDRWPDYEAFEWSQSDTTPLEALYQSVTDEDEGRKMRLKSEGQ